MSHRFKKFGPHLYEYSGIETTGKKSANEEAETLRRKGFLVRVFKDPRGGYMLYTRPAGKAHHKRIGEMSEGQWVVAVVYDRRGTHGTKQRVFVPKGERLSEYYTAGQFGKKSNI